MISFSTFSVMGHYHQAGSAGCPANGLGEQSILLVEADLLVDQLTKKNQHNLMGTVYRKKVRTLQISELCREKRKKIAALTAHRRCFSVYETGLPRWMERACRFFIITVSSRQHHCPSSRVVDLEIQVSALSE